VNRVQQILTAARTGSPATSAVPATNAGFSPPCGTYAFSWLGAVFCGYSGHRSRTEVKTAPGAESPVSEDIAQWCFPVRRQHSGKRESAEVPNAGAISVKLNKASSRLAIERGTGPEPIFGPSDGPVKARRLLQ
jgi:hypothetical protein